MAYCAPNPTSRSKGKGVFVHNTRFMDEAISYALPFSYALHAPCNDVCDLLCRTARVQTRARRSDNVLELFDLSQASGLAAQHLITEAE